jgi:adenylate cyclase
MKFRWRRWAICAAIAAGSVLGARLFSQAAGFQILNLKAYDAQFALRGSEPTHDIVLLVADQKALDTFQELRVFWHPYYAQAIEAAGRAGARVIGLDLAFGVPVEKWEPDHDRKLAEAVSSSPVPVVCGYVPALNTNQETLPVPVNMIAAAMGLAAYPNITADPDDFVRRQELIEAPSKDPHDPPPARALAMRVVEKFLSEDVTIRNGQLVLRNQAIPVSSERTIFINYAGPPGTFPRVSLADFLAAARSGNEDQLRDWVEGKIVLIGTDSVDDRFATPYYSFYNGSSRAGGGDVHRNTAGVEIHANIVRTILERRFLQDVSESWRWLALLATAGVTVSIVTGLRPSWAITALFAQGTAIAIFTQLLFRRGQLLSASELFLDVALSGLAAVVYRFATEERRGDLFRQAVSLFVGSEVSTALDNSQVIALSGKRQNVTIMFTDIRGFTAFAEKTSQEQGPEVLVQQLNEYLRMMVSLIMVYNGHVNKFIGDGMLVVFSDDDKGALPNDHAVRAVQCATRLVTARSQFETGAGIHTGVVVIGNVGSADKMEYTVLGDPVNLASRLESLNKEHKTKILLSEATYRLLPAHLKTTLIGTVQVRGKSAPLTIYSIPSTLSPEVMVVEHE